MPRTLIRNYLYPRLDHTGEEEKQETISTLLVDFHPDNRTWGLVATEEMKRGFKAPYISFDIPGTLPDRWEQQDFLQIRGVTHLSIHDSADEGHILYFRGAGEFTTVHITFRVWNPTREAWESKTFAFYGDMC